MEGEPYHVHGLEYTIELKFSSSLKLKLNYRFNTILIKMPAGNFADTDKHILKFIRRAKRNWNNQSNFGKKKNKVGGFVEPNFNTYYKATVMKTVWY